MNLVDPILRFTILTAASIGSKWLRSYFLRKAKLNPKQGKNKTKCKAYLVSTDPMYAKVKTPVSYGFFTNSHCILTG